MSNEIKNNERKVFLGNLPKWEKGTNKGKINWKECIGYEVDFIYEGLSGKVSIVRYNNPKNITIAYNGYEYDITPSVFSKGALGGVLKIITSEFKVEIGELFKDDKRNLTIIDRFYKKNKLDQNQKWYKYHCNTCNWGNGLIIEHALIELKCGCSCCAGTVVVPEINSIWATDRWMCNLGVSEEDAKRFTSQSSGIINTICPHCNKNNKNKVSDVYKYKSIGCTCGDTKKYPSKFITRFLDELRVDYTTEYKEEWSDNKRYDFHISEINGIIEAHGSQHPGTKYHNNIGFGSFKGKTKSPREELENDIYKEKLARDNGIKYYISIDCSISNMEFIKENILNSRLADLYDLSNINWLECEKFALSNRVKEVCDYWNQKEEWETAADLSDRFNLNRHTIVKYLTKGVKHGWCEYDANKEQQKGRKKANARISKKINIYKDGILLDTFESCSELSRKSKEMFGVLLNTKSISNLIVSEKSRPYKGYTFKYVN